MHQLIDYALHMDRYEVSTNLEPKGDNCGFLIKFLVAKAAAFKSKENWAAFNDVLALLIYGIVLLPNINDFGDMTIVVSSCCRTMSPPLLLMFTTPSIGGNRKGGNDLVLCAIAIKVVPISSPEERFVCRKQEQSQMV